MLLLCLETALAGPWVKDPGQAYVKASGLVFNALDYVDPLTGETEAQVYRGTNSSVYAEVGLAKGLQLQAALPYVTGRSYDGQSGYLYRSSGLGDAQLGFAVDVPKLELPASITVLARLPLYDHSTLVQGAPALGDENMDVDFLASVGHSLPLGQHWLWVTGTSGFRWRTNWAPSGNETLDFVNTLPLMAQVGLAPNFRDRSLGWLSLDYIGAVPLASDTITRGWHQFGAGVAVNTIGGVHLEGNAAWIPLATNVSTGWMAGAGLSWKR